MPEEVVNTEAEPVLDTAAAEESAQTGGEETDVVAAEPSAKTVPYERFQEVNEKAKRYEEYLRSIQNQNTPNPTPDESGNVDINQWAAAIKQQTKAEIQAQMAEEREWDRATREYPQLETDPSIARAIRGMRNQALIEGELISYRDAAQSLLGKAQKQAATAREEGRKEARESVTVQQRAGIAPPSSKEDRGSEKDEIVKRMNSGNHRIAEKAREEYLSKHYSR
jgi:hypothetical protein